MVSKKNVSEETLHTTHKPVNKYQDSFDCGLLFAIHTLEIMINGRRSCIKTFLEDKTILRGLKHELKSLLIAKKTLLQSKKNLSDAYKF